MTPTPRRALLALVALLAVLLPPAPALADQPQRLATQVVDPAGALGSGRADAESALTRLQTDTGIQLFVVFVESFDGTPARQWTDETATLSDLGDRDALLAVATVDRAYQVSFPADARITDAELDKVAAERIEPALGREDWAGAVVAAADGYREAATSSGSATLIWVLVIFVVVLAGAIAWVVIRRRRAEVADRPQATTPAGPTVEELTSQANALLVELDDDLRTSERELAMATGQYGAEATERFRAALEASRQDVAEAFRLRMTLDEPPGPDLVTLRGTLNEIIRRCTEADARLDAESEAFDELRDLEGRAAEVAAEVDRRRAEVAAALPATATALQDLSSRYAGPAVTAVSLNVDQATERLSFAATALSRVRAALEAAPEGRPTAPDVAAARADAATTEAGDAAAGATDAAAGATGEVPGGDRAEAALAVRAAEQAVDQAEQLLAAVHQAVTDHDAARRSADALIMEVEAELATGRAALTSPAHTEAGALTAAMSTAEQTLADTRAELAGATPDPIGVAARLQAADAALDKALADARDASERSARARSLLAQALPAARAEVAAANSYITTRRGAVDTSARSTLAEAERHLALAESLAAGDPVAAVTEAQQAQSLAATSSRIARNDVLRFSDGYSTSAPVEDDLFGAFLGGLLSGGSGGGYRSRDSYRSRSSGRSSWSGGGFGGSGSRSRRTSGGGGRRGGGGRF